MDKTLKDFRLALRRLRRTPGFTLVAVLTLALGIGANTAIFSVVNAALLRPLPYPDAGRIVQLYSTRDGGLSTVSPPDFTDWREQAGVFQGVAAINNSSDFTLTGTESPERVTGAQVTGDFFSVLQISPAIGRGFTPSEEVIGQNKVAILSYALWQQRFGGRHDIIGQSIELNRVRYTVVGVMPRDFEYPQGARLWTPLAFTADDLATQRGAHYLDIIARLLPGVSLEQARSAMAAVSQRLAVQYPKSNKEWRATAVPMRDALVGDVRPALLMLLGAVGLVLLIACVNVANLLLARSMTRARELAIRTALGAGRSAIVRGILTESMLLAILGGAAGLLVATWATSALVALQPDAIRGLGPVSMDGTVLAFTLLLVVVTGFVFGALPAMQASRLTDVTSRLKEGSRSATGGREWWRARGALVGVEMALAVMLLAGAGLLIRSFVRLVQTDPGFRTEHVLTFNLSLPDASYPKPEQSDAFFGRLLTDVRALPGVEAASGIYGLPLTDFSYQISVHDLDGRLLSSEEQDALRSPQIRVVAPDYFDVLGIRTLHGRPITEVDNATAARAVVVNETAARLYWPGEDAVGREITVGTSLGLGRGRVGGTVVGVVADTKDFGPAEATLPEVFFSHSQFPVSFMSVVVRTASPNSEALLGSIRERLRAIDPNVPIYQARTIDQLLGESVAKPRFYMLLLGAFALCALVLAAIGIYGVMAYVVGQRTHEIGVRMALGARGDQVLREVVARGMRPALVGLVAGIAGAFALTGVLSKLLYGVSATDPLTFIGVVLVLAAVALLANLVPARRAARVDPAIALRSE
ncbi:MAG TPA: ABC transporter permease [Gemmatimonadaceae bacterium]|nr:ABC transporter permease [Gemmatimonadaceae bacterium]